MYKKILPGLVSMLVLASCGTSYKTIPYFQNLNHTEITTEKVENYSALIIQNSDILGINVNSKDPESSKLFNYRVSGNSAENAADNPITGYLVDDKGNIQLPYLGNLKAAGRTTSQLRDEITTLLSGKYYTDPIVTVRIINFKVSVYGDVLKPGIYNIQNERATVTQALTLAGDLNITALRNILLIREQDGKRITIPLDLTSKNIFESPYYYLKNNDEIYVQPDRTKYATVDRGYRTATLVLSGVSIIAIVLSNLFRK